MTPTLQSRAAELLAVAEATGMLPKWCAVTGGLLREVDRLRAVLDLIAKQRLDEEVTDENERGFADYQVGYECCVRAARAALEAKP